MISAGKGPGCFLIFHTSRKHYRWWDRASFRCGGMPRLGRGHRAVLAFLSPICGALNRGVA